jgi:glycerol kinase
MGLSRGSGRAQIARAVVEALAFQVRAMTDAFREGGVTISELRADGGAAAMNLLLQLQATNSRVPVVRSTSLEATARGAATAAGLEAGVWSSFDALRQTWTSDFVASPEDPTFVDLGYEAWMQAASRA